MNEEANNHYPYNWRPLNHNKKERTIGTHDNIDESENNDAEWQKPGNDFYFLIA